MYRYLRLLAFILPAVVLIGWFNSAGPSANFVPLTTRQDLNSPILDDGIWQDMTDISALRADENKRLIIPQSYRVLSLNQDALTRLLRLAPMEFSAAAQIDGLIMRLPMPDYTYSRFRIEESPIMETELAAQFPEIKTYRGQGIDDPTATLRFDWTPDGFHAMVLSSNGTTYIDPYSKGDTKNYVSYYKRNYFRKGKPFHCLVAGSDLVTDERDELTDDNRAKVSPNGAFGTSLRTYRLALATTGEFTQFHGGTVGGGMSAITTIMNRVNGVYERELAIRMVFAANQSALIYTNPVTDPYSNANPGTLLSQNQSNLNAVIGNANYDIGHVFSTGGGGLAGLGVVCQSDSKAQGETGLDEPIGDAFSIDFVAHEMGHQFGANHTFNGTTGSCGGGNREPFAAYEPGSGSTIMAYAGICDSENLQQNSDDYFHAKSLSEIINFITTGGNCASQTATGNTPPTADAGANFTIPRSTPFTLTAAGSDANGDAITYCWEEFDLGTASPPNTDSGNRPIFRSFDPVSSPSRTFPQLSSLINNASVLGESLPSTTRTMNFRVTVRDNRANGGAINDDSMVVNVSGASGPFTITAPNTAINWSTGSTQNVTWNVANTASAPVSAANVKISLSTNGGNTFPIVLAASTPNDGTQTIAVPMTFTTSARVKVEAIGNIFFDISNVNFTIQQPGLPIISSFTPLSGTVGAPVTISGTDLNALSSVKFAGPSGGVTASPITVNSSSSIQVNVPVGAISGVITVANQVGSTQSQSIFKVLPKIVSFTPSSGVAGNNVTIAGSNLSVNSAAPTVKFGTLTANLVSFSAAQIVAAVPSGAVNGKITVTTVDGAGTSATDFIIVKPPTITSFTLASGPIGTAITINGSNLSSVTEVKFNGVSAGAPQIISATSIKATVPAGASTGKISATNAAGTAMSVGIFKVSPRVDSFAPASVIANDSVTITGLNLKVGITNPTVRIGSVVLPVSSATETTVVVTVPATALTGKISVTTVDGTGMSVDNITVIKPPTIASFTLASGPIGAAITINGSNLSSVTEVKFNGVSAGAPQVISATSIKATVPVGASTGKISATNAAGTAMSVGIFKVSPRVDSFAPGSVIANDSVTITGLNLKVGITNPTVRIGSVVLPVSSATETTVVVTVPATAATGKISVTTIDGTGISVDNITVIKPPTITSFTPASSPIGTAITINGSNLSSVTQVKFNGVSAGAPQVVSATSIKATVPAGASTGKISATNAAGTAMSVGIFKVSPRVDSFAPGSVIANDSVTITGLNLKVGITNPTVRIGSVVLPISSATETTVVVTVPATALTGKISVTTVDGTGMSADNITVIKPPTIASFTLASGPIGAAITINGSNLSSVTEVKFNGVSAGAPQIISATSIKATVPVGASTGKISATNAAGTAMSVGIFKVSPRVDSFAPGSVIANGSVTITGLNLKVGITNPTVRIGSVVLPVSSATETTVVVTVPATAATGKISVTTVDGTGMSVDNITVIKPPTIASFTPASSPIGTAITINGSNLSSITQVKFNGVSAGAPQVISTASIKATVPAGASTGKISVTNAAGTAMSAATFTVTP